jgi:hypothetical protein
VAEVVLLPVCREQGRAGKMVTDTILETSLSRNHNIKFPSFVTDNKRELRRSVRFREAQEEHAIKKFISLCLFALAASVFSEENVEFRNFPWGTSLEEFTAVMGEPVYREEADGLASLVYENVEVSGFNTYMLAYFSESGLEGGTYYFLTENLDEIIDCYRQIQKELVEKYGPTVLQDGIIRERRPYETSWDLAGGYVYLKVNTRTNEPVTLWYSSPALTRKLLGRS